MRTFSALNRTKTWENIQAQTIDVLVIGGGITGAGIALDASTRGMKTVVVDMQDFAAGTSSRSTKLIHGGLRYLQQFQIKVVAEVGKEREIVYKNAPHITTPLWMLLPLYKGGTFGPMSTRLGLTMYDFLAGVKKTERKKMLSKKEALEKEPLLQQEGLLGAGYYVEYRTDDARLTIETLKKAVQFGADAFSYAEVTECLYDENGKIIGARIYDHTTKQWRDVFARTIVNASGPWVDHIRTLDESTDGKSLYITKGVHIIFDQADFPLQQPIYFDAPDGRMIFAIPRAGVTYVGTTDTHYTKDYQHPVITTEDETYLLHATNTMFPALELDQRHIVSKYAGLRPLIAEEGKDASEISRKDELFTSPSGLISIAGGKLTGYRKMAQKVVDQVTEDIQEKHAILYTPSSTKHIALAGGEFENIEAFHVFAEVYVEKGKRRNINEQSMKQCLRTYGKNCETILSYFDEMKEQKHHTVDERFILSQLKYSILYESVYTPADFLIRRTSRLYFHTKEVKHYQEIIGTYMEHIFKWSAFEKESHMQQLADHLERVTQ